MTAHVAAGRTHYPAFRDLPTLPGSQERHAWDVWGRDDQVGCMNFAGPEQVRQAVLTVAEGKVVSLNLPLNEPAPGLFPKRSPFQHTILTGSHGRDDRLDGFFPQFSSQWDGLRHVRYRQYGFWGGRQDDAIDSGGELGVEHWSRRGVVTRGVLIDVKGFHERRGGTLSATERHPLSPDDLDRVLAAQGSVLRQGDVVVLRTGWLEWYLSLSGEERLALRGSVGQGPGALACPGLDAHQETAEWLWDHRLAGVASDNPALEALPVDKSIGFFHYRLIPLLGMAVGEFWNLAAIAADCAALGRFEFLLTSAVLDVPGGVGSPANAYAVL
jgi:Putative cyclase